MAVSTSRRFSFVVNTPQKLSKICLTHLPATKHKERKGFESWSKNSKPYSENTLELDPQKRGADVDAVRKFLAEHGLPLKTARAVLDNFRRYWDQPLPKDAFRPHERPSASVIAECERMSDGKKNYYLSKSLARKCG